MIVTFVAAMLVLIVSGCHYRRGSSYTYQATGDSITYMINTKGSGRQLIRKKQLLEKQHALKEDDCRFIFISDSASLYSGKCVMLFNSRLPDVEDDMLSGGFMAAFGTKQIIVYLLVTKTDFDKYLKPAHGKNQH
jgi:hypothetical protein